MRSFSGTSRRSDGAITPPWRPLSGGADDDSPIYAAARGKKGLSRSAWPRGVDRFRTPWATISFTVPPADTDGDGVSDSLDNCRSVQNPNQADTDMDGVGDACNDAQDADGDEWADTRDNCPSVPNADQATADTDALGNACDLDDDNDGLLDDDESILGTNPLLADSDSDGRNDLDELLTGVLDPLEPRLRRGCRRRRPGQLSVGAERSGGLRHGRRRPGLRYVPERRERARACRHHPVVDDLGLGTAR